MAKKADTDKKPTTKKVAAKKAPAKKPATKKTTPKKTPAKTTVAKKTVAKKPAAKKPAAKKPAKKNAEAENTLVMETTKGRVVIKMRPDLAPKHVDRIRELTREGFYDGIVFHRVIDGFMAQCGCPHGIGTGGSSKPNLAAEFNAEPHTRGICSMARAQHPDTANSQFFICFDDARFLDRQYTVWGQVVEGMENIDTIKRGEPVHDPDSIISMKVEADI